MNCTFKFPAHSVECFVAGKTAADAIAVNSYLHTYKNRLLVRLNQQHTDKVLVLTKQNVNSQSDQVVNDLTCPADAVLSDRSAVVLSVRTADCLPILLYHPSGVIGAIHAGRKGTELGILRATLLALKAEWQITNNLILWFGPAICENCYQIDRTANLRYDLREKNRQQAESIFPHHSINIIESEHCTFHDNADWYSYRKEGKGVGMNVSYITL